MILLRPVIIMIFLGVFFWNTPVAMAASETTQLPVPHIWEIPDGVWVKPWNGACEEASIIMVDKFYQGNPRAILNKAISKKLMNRLFPIEDRLFGSNADTNATRTQKLINDYSNFDAVIKRHPTLEEIQSELEAGRPVISLHYGYDLNNPRHRFRRGGSSYHMMVLTGFDNVKKSFYVNDPELSDGIDFPYNYDTIMASLRDFNHATHEADGEPTVLFTEPKMFVRAENAKRVYLVREGVKYLVASPKALQNHGWSLKNIITISREELARYETGPAFDN
ncbi:MAG: C39 family peptidase [Candidatus Magasanikbacteria bacterium]|nr:C39 family peptidase [Candidatus Magasanikbacteria bacterium]